jgi:hypothetical protein
MTAMARATLIVIFTVLTVTRLLGNPDDLIFRFTARHTCLHAQMDSILIENLTNHEYWMLYYPDTVITIISTGLTGIDAGTGELEIRNYPNPFKGQTHIELFVPETDRFQIRIYDLDGRMASIFEDLLEQGVHKFTFFSGNQNVYLLSVSSHKYSKSLLLLQPDEANGIKPRIAYDGRNMDQINQSPVNSGMRTMKRTYDLSYDPGDEMRFTAFVTTLTGEVDQASIQDSPHESADFTFDISNQVPALPSEITGMDWVPGKTTDLLYEVIQEEGVNYLWSLPESWSFADLQQSHQVIATSGNQSGNLSVRGENTCGTGPARILPVKLFFTISLEAEPTEGGTVTPEYAEIEAGEKITVEAEPQQDWELIEWTGDVEGNETSLELTISDNIFAKAKFDRVKLVSIHVVNPVDTLVISYRHKFRVTGTYSNGDTIDLTDEISYRGITDKITMLDDNTMVGARSGIIKVELAYENLSAEEDIYVYEVEFVDIDKRFISSNDDCALRVPVLIINYFPTYDGLHHDQSVGPTDFWSGSLPVVSLDAVRVKVMEDFIVSKQIIEYGTRFRDYGSGNVDPYICMDVVKYINVYEINLVPWRNNLKTIDYHKLFRRLGIEDLVIGHGIKEIWMSIFPKNAIPSVIANGYDDPSTYYDYPESNMSSPTTGDISNSWRDPYDLPVYSSTYVVYGHNNHRGVDTFLHNRGHQIEAQMLYIEKNKVPGKHLFWNQFIGYVNGVYTQRCGNTHFPPNGESDYDYVNPKIVNSDIQNWIPEGGQKSPVNVDTWTKIKYDIDMRVNRFGFYMDNYHNDSHTKWLLYWFQSIPGQNNNIPYQRDGKTYMLNNWWDLFYNWDDAINNNLTLWNENEVSD